MAATVPTKEPLTIRAGDTIEWTKSIDDYKASDGSPSPISPRACGDVGDCEAQDHDGGPSFHSRKDLLQTVP